MFSSPVPEGWWKLGLHETWYIFVFIIIFITLFFLLRNRSFILKWLNLEDEEVTSLKKEIATLQDKIRTMENVVTALISRIADMTPHNQIVLPPTLRAEVQIDKAIEVRKILRPVLLVYGDAEFGEQDRNALRRAGVQFFRLRNAGLEVLKEELHRRRSEGTLYDMVHISAHGNGEELLFEGGKVSGMELADTLFGVRGLFLATCKNQEVADRLIGIVQNVVVIYEDIASEQASNFVFEFYKRYKVNRDIAAAFNGALEVMPDIAEFVDLRTGGK